MSELLHQRRCGDDSGSRCSFFLAWGVRWWRYDACQYQHVDGQCCGERSDGCLKLVFIFEYDVHLESVFKWTLDSVINAWLDAYLANGID